MKSLLLSLFGLAITSGGLTHATSVPLPSAHDNTLYEDPTGSTSNGSGPTFFAGENGGGSTHRGLIAFDFSALPAGAVIQSVSLVLFLTKAQSFPTDVALHRVLAAWGEGASSAGNRAGGGAASAPGDATWIHTFYPGSLWSSPGGDFAAIASGSTVVGAQGATYSWASTPAMVADVQGWVDAPATNNGWLLHGDETQSSTAKAFATREESTASKRPVLNVTYSVVPEPSTLALGVAGAFVLMRRRRILTSIPRPVARRR